MRLRLIMAILALASAARADPLAAPGYVLTPVETTLAMPSGLAVDGEALVATDLATGRVVRIGAGGATLDLTAPLRVGKDVLGEPTPNRKHGPCRKRPGGPPRVAPGRKSRPFGSIITR